MIEVFIDESGDLGNNFYNDEKRCSYWFIMTAIFVDENNIDYVVNEINNTKKKLNRKKNFHFKEDKHTQRIIFLNKIATLNKYFKSITIALDKTELANIVQNIANKELLSAQQIYEHIMHIFIKEIYYMYHGVTNDITLQLNFEENKTIDYDKIFTLINNMAKDNFNFKTCKCTKNTPII